MASINQTSWWLAPRRIADRLTDRRVSFLELFYDLVYVVIIAEIAHRLSTHMDGHGLLVYGGMFAIVWWAWLNGTLYHDLHGNNDLRTRVFTFIQMISVGAMAVFAYGAVGEYSRQFAFAYAAFQVILGFLWLSTGIHDPAHRPLSIPYSSGVFLSAAAFFASAFVDGDARFTIWAIATFVSLFGFQAIMFLVAKLSPSVNEQMERSFDPQPSQVERFGLFTIIVLGEVIVGVVRGVVGNDRLDWMIGGTGALGMVLAIGLWWVYFDFVSERMPRKGRITATAWMYLHLPLTLGIAAAGAAVLNAIEVSPDSLSEWGRFILVGSVALALLSVLLIGEVVEGSATHARIHAVSRWFMLGSAIAAVGLGFAQVATVPLLACLGGLLLAPVAAGFAVWVLGGSKGVTE